MHIQLKILSQLFEIMPQIKTLDEANRGFIIAYYNYILRYIKNSYCNETNKEPELTEAQKTIMEKIETEANDRGLPGNLHEYINVMDKDEIPKMIEETLAPYNKSISLIVGEDFAESYYAYLGRVHLLAVSRTMRSSKPHAHTFEAVDALLLIHDFHLDKHNLLQALRKRDNETGPFLYGYGGDGWELDSLAKLRQITDGFPWRVSTGAFPLLVGEIERGNAEIIGFVSDTLMGGDEGGQASRTIIRAVQCAGNTMLHEQLGKLLLAARLEEGLRSAILERAARYSPEAFLHLVKVINDNGLIRFSSVKKDVRDWLSLGVERAKSDRVFTKLFSLAAMYLADAGARQKATQSSDSLELLAGLWSIAFYDASEMACAVRDIVKSGDRHRMKVVAYYLLNNNWIINLRHEAAKAVLTEYPDDIELCAAYNCLFFQPVWRIGNRHYSNHNIFKTHYYDYTRITDSDPKLENCFADENEALRFYHIYASLVERMGADSITAEASGVEWYSVTMYRQYLLCKMLGVIYLTNSSDLIGDFLSYWNVMAQEMRTLTVYTILCKPETGAQWDMLVTALGDKARSPRESAYEILSGLFISPENLLKIEGYLKSKAGDLRQKVLALLIKQPAEALLETLRRLLASPSREVRQGGLSLAMDIKQNDEFSAIHEDIEALVSGLTDTTHTEKTLAEQVKAETKPAADTDAVENAFGLADPASRPELPAVGLDFDLEDAFPLPWDEVPVILKELEELINTHADFEYRDHDGDTQLVGNFVTWLWQSKLFGVEDLPLEKIWRGFYVERIKEPRALFQIHFFSQLLYLGKIQINKIERVIGRVFGNSLFRTVKEYTTGKPLALANILRALRYSYRDEWKEERLIITKLYGHIWNSFSPDERWRETETHAPWDSTLKMEVSILDYSQLRFLDAFNTTAEANEEFTASFTLWYAVHLESLDRKYAYEFHFDMFRLAKAVSMGIVPYDELILEMTCRKDSHLRLSNAFENLLDRRRRGDRYSIGDYEVMQKAVETVADKLTDIELARGDTATPATRFVPYIKRVKGVQKMVALMLAIGDAPFARALPSEYGYYPQDHIDRLVSLSSLLFNSIPAESDTAESLAEALENTGITEKKLIELAMYNHRWSGFIGKHLGWDGFESGCWYFRAHMNEWFTKEAVTEIEKYSPITTGEFCEGAFDALWFEKVSAKLGEKRFAKLYDAAKYTAGGSKHARARKFADAARGKLDIADTREQIGKKRNKDLLLAYTLIPLKDKNDLLDRYLFLQNFLKESRQFGKQRQESEKITVGIAMKNLARTAGYSDTMRLTWVMETSTIEKIRPYFSPRKIRDCDLHIHVDDEGAPHPVCEKDGKTLNSVPAGLKKDETVSEMQKLCKTLSEQHKRARTMLENSMVAEEPFEVSELRALSTNPIIYPLIKNLVFRCGDALGYIRDGKLADIAGVALPLADADELVIAHPIHLYKGGNWSAWQSDLFSRQIRQPFKQVFREFYIKLPEEMDCFETCRYEGNQVQPRRAYSLLTSRRWSEAGFGEMQRVFHKQETFAVLTVSGDWGTPAEIEPPELCSVEFYAYDADDRRKPISEISDIVFSEAMRDVDLIVSVAHAGRVDPQFSHSTVEMRCAVARCTLEMLGVKNVRLEGSHAFIDGKIGSYNIHMGSGVIHQKGGAMISVLPVHSQQRGRIFLPFVDDDPKTAEIMSKILLFADDAKIKDPSILSQIG